MADSEKPKRGRQKGGYALIEMVEEKEGEGPARVFEILASNMDSQAAAKTHLKEQLESKEIVADGKRTFGIIQVKTLNLVPRTDTKVTVTW